MSSRICSVLSLNATLLKPGVGGGGVSEGGGSVLALMHAASSVCRPTAEWDPSSEPPRLFSPPVVVNRSKAGAGGPLSATGAAAVPVERR